MSRAGQQPKYPLALSGIWKTYPGVQAVRDASFACLERGEIHALVGENGAGKSTLMAIASGNVSADSGQVLIGGRKLEGRQASAARLGLGMSYQDDALVPDVTVAENLRLGAPPGHRPHFRELSEWAADQLDRFAVSIDPRSFVRELSLSARQVVDITRALVAEPHVLILDEPTSALAPDEVARLHESLRQLSASGTTIVYITHRLTEVFALAHYVSVMRDGAIVTARSRVESTTEDGLVTQMVGRSIGALFPTRRNQSSERSAALVVENLSGSTFRDVALTAQPGEIIGFAGIEGNGQRDVMRAIAGLGDRGGRVAVNDRDVRPHSVRDARKKGLVYVSGDRRRESLFPTFGVRANMTTGNLGRLFPHGLVRVRDELEVVGPQISQLSIRASSPEQNVLLLSGGNQQKVVLSRAFLATPVVYLVDEPTQGVDAGARAETYRILREVASDGAVVVVLSSDAVELAGLCDRVFVFVRGRIAAELEGDRLSEDSIVATAVTHQSEPGVDTSSTSSRDHADPRSSRKRGLRRWVRESDFAPVALLLLMLAAIVGFTGARYPLFVSADNIGNILFLTVPLGFAALGQAAAMLIGGIDLSIGPVMALSTVAVAQLMGEEGAFSRGVLAIAAALAIGAGVGLLNAVLILRLRLTPLIATLATYILIQGVALLWLSAPGGYIPISAIDGAAKEFVHVPWAFAFVAVVAVVLEVVYRRSTFGQWYRAVGSRAVAAGRVGAPTDLIRCLAYVAAGLLGAVGGVFFAMTIGIGDPALGVSFTLASIAAVVLGGLSTWGGRGSLVGPLIGALLLGVIANASSFYNFPSQTQLFVQGGLLVGSIALYSRLRASGSARDEMAVR